MCASFLLPAISCLSGLSVTEWSQMCYWKFCAKTSHTTKSLELSSLNSLGVSLRGQDGTVPLPPGCYTAQPHSERITTVIRSQKPNAYINVIILRPSYFPVPYCVWWSGRAPKAAVVFCLRPFPKASLCSSAIPWGTLLEEWHASLWTGHFFLCGGRKRWTKYTEYKTQV